MRLFKKKSGLNPLDAPSKRSINTMMVSNSDGKRQQKPYASSLRNGKNPSFQVTERDVRRMNVLGSEHLNTKHTHWGEDIQELQESPTKKKGWFKRFRTHRKKSKLKRGHDHGHSKSTSESSMTIMSPASTSATKDFPATNTYCSVNDHYFSMPTQGFECILDPNDLEHHNVNIENNTCQNALAENMPMVAATTQACIGDTSPLYNWESFVALLTATNQTLITTIHDANDTLQSFLEESDDEKDGQKEEDANGTSMNGRRNKNHANDVGDPNKKSPVKEVTFNLSNYSLPFDEKSDGEKVVETDNEGPSSSIENLSTTAQPADMNKEGMMLFQQQVQRQQLEKQQQKQQQQSNKKKDAPLTKDQQQYQQENETLRSTAEEKTTQPAKKPLVMPYEVPNLKAPVEDVFDSSFTLSFLRDVSSVGILLTYFKVPTEGENVDEIPSTFVNLSIKPGLSRGARLLEPKLCWSAVDNDNRNNNQTEKYSISLLGIHSINTSLNSSTDDDQTQFFTITTDDGDVHVFEAPTILERHNVVNGIRNVVAWLSYHLVMGNMASGTKLVSNLDEEQGEQSGELPSLKTPAQAMNDLSHSFLD